MKALKVKLAVFVVLVNEQYYGPVDDLPHLQGVIPRIGIRL